MQTAADLVGTVRGRRLCFELAQFSANGDEVRAALFDDALAVHEERGDLARGTVARLVAQTSVDSGPGSPAAPAAPALGDALTAAAAAWAVRPGDLLAALSDTVSSAMYWQPPHAEDAVLARPSLRGALAEIADVVLREPSAAWWSTPLDRDAQTRTQFEVSTVPDPPRGTATERLHRWRDAVADQERAAARYRARHPATPLGGTWWVTPALAGLDTTTRALAGAGSASLWLTEDEMGWESADLVPCAVDPAARVLEIDGPDAWSTLVQTYPLDVTSSRAPDWWGAVEAREGAWLIPDWSAVAADYDGVHVSVLAWLMTSGQAVPVGPATTTLAGWNPDATWWLADTVRPVDPGRRWVRHDQRWLPAG
ncbi:MAG: hypothetical protein ACOH2F_04655 [Cellulomonas sp.]